MANKPEELKNIILKMRPDDITRTFIQENFGNMYDEKSKKVLPSKFNTADPITLKPNEYYNKEEIKTTLGRLVTNKFFFEDGLREIVGYVNEPITKKKLKKIDETIANALLDNKVDIATIKKYYNKQQWLGLSVHSILCSSFTPETIKPLPEVLKLKEELFKKYEEDLKGPNGVIYANKIETMLIEEAKKVLDKDPGMSLYKSGARGSFENNYKNMFIIRGPVYNNVTKRFDVLKNSFAEGIEKDNIPSYASQVISGAYPKAVGTRDAGYYSKKFFAVYQTTVLDEQGSDCGSKKYRLYHLTEKNYSNVKYRWINDNGKLVCLTPEIAPKYYGKTVQMRSPLYCTQHNICSKCAGDLAYRMKLKNIGLTVPDIASTYLNRLMKAFHSAVVDIYEIKIDNMML